MNYTIKCSLCGKPKYFKGLESPNNHYYCKDCNEHHYKKHRQEDNVMFNAMYTFEKRRKNK